MRSVELNMHGIITFTFPATDDLSSLDGCLDENNDLIKTKTINVYEDRKELIVSLKRFEAEETLTIKDELKKTDPQSDLLIWLEACLLVIRNNIKTRTSTPLPEEEKPAPSDVLTTDRYLHCLKKICTIYLAAEDVSGAKKACQNEFGVSYDTAFRLNELARHAREKKQYNNSLFYYKIALLIAHSLPKKDDFVFDLLANCHLCSAVIYIESEGKSSTKSEFTHNLKTALGFYEQIINPDEDTQKIITAWKNTFAELESPQKTDLLKSVTAVATKETLQRFQEKRQAFLDPRACEKSFNQKERKTLQNCSCAQLYDLKQKLEIHSAAIKEKLDELKTFAKKISTLTTKQQAAIKKYMESSDKYLTDNRLTKPEEKVLNDLSQLFYDLRNSDNNEKISAYREQRSQLLKKLDQAQKNLQQRIMALNNLLKSLQPKAQKKFSLSVTVEDSIPTAAETIITTSIVNASQTETIADPAPSSPSTKQRTPSPAQPEIKKEDSSPVVKANKATQSIQKCNSIFFSDEPQQTPPLLSHPTEHTPSNSLFQFMPF